MSLIQSAYTTVHNALASLPTSADHLALINVEADATSDPIPFTVYYYLAQAGPKHLNTSYGTEDHWMWWNGQPNGSASQYCPCATNPTAIGLCADKQIEKRLNLSVGIPHGSYFTDVIRWTVTLSATDLPGRNHDIWDPDMLNPDDPTSSGDGYRDQYLFTCHKDQATQQWLCSSCLEPEEMEWYTRSTWEAMEFIRINHTSRAPDPHLTFRLCKIDGDMCSCYDGSYIHTAVLEYGILRQGGGNGGTQ